jgi:hypothetical protein
MGALKGSPCQVKNVVHQDGINTVTFEWEGTDGTTKTRDMVVYDGTPIYVWESGNTYHYGDLAIYESQFYRCIVENNDATFDSTKWNEIGSPDGNYDIVQSVNLLPARFTAADRKLYYVIDENCFYLWNGTTWVKTISNKIADLDDVNLDDLTEGDVLVWDSVNEKWVNKAKFDEYKTAFTGTEEEWDALTSEEQNVYDIMNITNDGDVLNLGVYLEKKTAMPVASEDVANRIYLYTGTTTQNYKKGVVYQCVSNGQTPTTYSWVALIDFGTAAIKNSTDRVLPNSTDLVESRAVYSAINTALSSIYTPRGNITCAELTSALLISDNIGSVYETSDSGTTTALFLQGAGRPIAVGSNIGVINAGQDRILFNLMPNAFDLTSYQKKDLTTPITIDGTQETEVENALGGLNEAVDKRVTYAYNSKMGAKNLNSFPYYDKSKTIDGVTFTVNNDGSVTLNGTTTSTDIGFRLHSNQIGTDNQMMLNVGKYILSGTPSGLGWNAYLAISVDGSNWITDNGDSKSFTVNNDDTVISFLIKIAKNNYTFDNVTFYPMIRLASDQDNTWTPYAMSNKVLTDNIQNMQVTNIAENTISITAFGGKSNVNTQDNSDKLMSAIQYAMDNKYTLYVPNGSYIIKDSIELTNSLMIEGATTYGVPYRMGAVLIFDPQNHNKTFITDNGTQYNISIKHVNLWCEYTHFTTNSITEAQETPYEYYSWSYDYDNVNCLDIAHSILFLEDVGIKGFSGYGLKCGQNVTISNIKVFACKYGFYNCATDVIFNTCYVTQCEYGFYWYDTNSVLFIYDTWIDQCGYGIYSAKGTYGTTGINGTITGLIDHCLYAGIYVWRGGTTSLSIDARMGRCGMYYTGTDMLTHTPSADSELSFNDMSKGVFVAMHNVNDINIKLNTVPRPIDDLNTGTNKLPTLLVFGNKLDSAIIETSYDFGDRIYKLMDNTSQVNVINCNNVQTISNRNLLDNPWFTINQRNLTTYSTPSSGKRFTVDRWAENYHATVVKNTNGITITSDSSGDNGDLGQTIDGLYSYLVGKLVTASVMLQNGKIYSKSDVLNANLVGAIRFDLENGFKCDVNTNSSNSSLGFYIYSGSDNADASISVRAVKLELGGVSTLTNDTMPNEAQELAKCMRYFERNNWHDWGCVRCRAAGILQYGMTYPFLVKKRGVPTFTFNVAGAAGIGNGYVYDITDGTSIPVSEVTLQQPSAYNYRMIQVKMSHSSFVVGHDYCLAVGDNVIDISADI